MKLYMKQKVFSWRDKFSVASENGEPRYFAEGEFLSLGKKLHIYDTTGAEQAFIRQKVLSFLPRYFVEIGGRVVCEIVKEFTLLRPKYRIDGLPWRVDGDFWAHEYSLNDGQREIMRLSKAWFTWGDSYELDIADAGDELLCVSVALAIDAVLASEQSAASSSSNH
jgi:uncharacterized protein YxjI